MYKCASAVFLVIMYMDIAKGVFDETQTNSSNESDKKNFTNEINGSALQKECSENLNAKCLKMHVLSFIEYLNTREELPLLGGLSLVKEKGNDEKNPKEMAVELARQFPGKPEEKLNRFLLYRLQDFLEGHSLRYKLIDPETSKDAINMVAVGRRSGGGKGGNKGGGGMGAMMAAGMMMKGTLAAAALAALALLAGKAMTTALMSLLLSAIVGFKSGGEKGHTTYEIITKPEISHHHSHSQEEQHEYDHGHGHHGYHRRAYDYDNSYNPYNNPS